MMHRLLLLALLSLFALSAGAQDARRTTVSAELGGMSWLGGAVIVEQPLAGRVTGRAGLGFATDLSGDPRALSIPLGVVYVGGQGRYRPELGAGFAVVPAYFGDYWFVPYPYVGLRYESPNGPLFRIGFVGLIDLDGPGTIYPIPGISYGWRL